MAKDPAVLFYTSDFLSGTAMFTDAQAGKYIRLLCIQHQSGGINPDYFDEQVPQDSPIRSKFVLENDGFYRNQRMKTEAEKRKNFVKSRHENLKKVKEKPTHMGYHTDAHMKHHMVPHMENENENRNINDNKGIGGVGEKVFFEKSINDEGWQEVVMRTCDIKDPVAWITKFNDHSIATEEHYNRLADWRRHCVNWIKREIEKLNKQQTNGKQPKSARSEMDKLRDWYESVNAPTTGSGGE